MPENDKSSNDKPRNGIPQEADSRETLDLPAADIVMIYATFPSRDSALALGRRMVEDGIAGCVNVFPAMTSVYVWKGVTETAEEAVMIAKLGREGAARAATFIVANHPYETPAVLTLPVSGGHAAYLSWLLEGTRGVAG